MVRMCFAMLGCLAFAAPVMAEELNRVEREAEFVGLVSGKALTRLGVTLEVAADGSISGRAFGRPVTGAWRWNGGLFCRDLYFGKQDLGPNCQVVQSDAETVRFIADEGNGDHADFSLK